MSNEGNDLSIVFPFNKLFAPYKFCLIGDFEVVDNRCSPLNMDGYKL